MNKMTDSGAMKIISMNVAWHQDRSPLAEALKHIATRLRGEAQGEQAVAKVCVRIPGVGEGGPYPVVDGVCVLPPVAAEQLIASAAGREAKIELLTRWGHRQQPVAVAGDVESRAREFLAAQYERSGAPSAARAVREGTLSPIERGDIIPAIVAALSSTAAPDMPPPGKPFVGCQCPHCGEEFAASAAPAPVAGDVPRSLVEKAREQLIRMGWSVEIGADAEAVFRRLLVALREAPVAGDADEVVKRIAKFIKERDDALLPDDHGDGERAESARLILAMAHPAPAVAYMVDGNVEQGLTFDKSAAEAMAFANCGTVRALGFTAAAALAQDRASQGGAAGVPDGWRLVPVGATPEMIKAGVKMSPSVPSVWAAMLAAAPTPAAEREVGDVG